MKSIPFTLALTVSMAVLAWPAAADAPAHWGCKGGRTDEAEISSRATHIGMRRVLEQYQNSLGRRVYARAMQGFRGRSPPRNQLPARPPGLGCH